MYHMVMARPTTALSALCKEAYGENMQAIARIAHRQGFTQVTLAKRIGVVETTLARHFREVGTKRCGTIQRYGKALKLSKLGVRWLTGSLSEVDLTAASQRLHGLLMRSRGLSNGAVLDLFASYVASARLRLFSSFVKTEQLFPEELDQLVDDLLQRANRRKCPDENEAAACVLDLVTAIARLGLDANGAAAYAKTFIQYLGDQDEISDAQRLLKQFESDSYVRLATGEAEESERQNMLHGFRPASHEGI